ncbi:MAG: hypothetical protein AAGC60_21150 [Acidobacteriota bacterium]
MKRYHRACWTLVLACLASQLVGCKSADLVGRKAPAGAPGEREVDAGTQGISYYLTEPTFVIQVKGLRDKKKANPVYDLVMVPVPDIDHRYEVGLRSGAFTNDTFELELLDDGRLVSLGASSEDQTGEIVKSLGSFVGSVAKAAGALAALSEAQVFENAREGLSRAASAGEITASEAGGAKDAVKYLFAPELQGQLLEMNDLDSAVEALLKALVVAERLASEESDSEKRGARLIEAYSLANAASSLLVAAQLRADRGWAQLSPEDRRTEDAELFRLIGDGSSWQEADVEKVQRALSQDGTAAGELEKLRRKVRQLNAKLASILRKVVFGDGDLAQAEEDPSLAIAGWIDLLDDLDASLTKAIGAAGPQGQIKAHLRKEHGKAKVAYAKYVRGEIDKGELEKELEGYDQVVGRLLEYDSKLRAAILSAQTNQLQGYLDGEPVPVDNGNTSKAYRDYRLELDEVARRIHERLGVYLAEKETKKPEDLPDGDTVSRTLDDVKKWEIQSRDQLFANDQKLLRLADLWIEYGSRDAVVFVARSSKSAAGGDSAGGAQ